MVPAPEILLYYLFDLHSSQVNVSFDHQAAIMQKNQAV